VDCDAQISPDGATVAFVRVTVNEKENRYEASLFAVPASGGEALGGSRPGSATRRHAGRRTVSGSVPCASVEKDGKTQPTQVHLPGHGRRRPRAITDSASGGEQPGLVAGREDDRVNSSTGVDDGTSLTTRSRRSSGKSDVVVVTPRVYRANGKSRLHRQPPTMRMFYQSQCGKPARDQTLVRPPKQKQLTDGEFDERGMEWARNGSKIYFVSTRVPEHVLRRESPLPKLFAVPSRGRTDHEGGEHRR